MKLIPSLAIFTLALPTQLSTCGEVHDIPTTTEACACQEPAHGARVCDDTAHGPSCGPCMCLPLEPVPPDPLPTTTFYVNPDVAPGGDGSASSPWQVIDWPAVDRALAAGDTHVLFSSLEQDGTSAEVWPARLDVLRTDTGPHRVVLDGIRVYNVDDTAPRWLATPDRTHAIVPGISTDFDNIAATG